MSDERDREKITHSTAEIVAATRKIIDRNIDNLAPHTKDQLGLSMAINPDSYLNKLVSFGVELFFGSQEKELKELADALQFGELRETEGAIKLYGYVMGRIDVLAELRKNNE